MGHSPWPGFRALAAEALFERVTTLRRLGACAMPSPRASGNGWGNV